jgi:hypothetical protein
MSNKEHEHKMETKILCQLCEMAFSNKGKTCQIERYILHMEKTHKSRPSRFILLMEVKPSEK